MRATRHILRRTRCTFDGENRITEAESASNGNAYYAYDGDGRRVAKAWTPNGGSQVLTYYIYDIAGRIAAEYSDGTLPEPDLVRLHGHAGQRPGRDRRVRER